MTCDGIEIPAATDPTFGKWCYIKLNDPMWNRGKPCYFKCPKCEHTNTSTIPVHTNSFKYEKCSKCGQMFFFGLMKQGYGPSSYDDFIIVTKVYKGLFETLQSEESYLEPRKHPDYDLSHGHDPQSNYVSFCKQIALARNYQILSKFVDYGTPIGL